MNSPLNPVLYSRLKEEFGDVKVSNAGRASIMHYQPDALTGRMRAQMTTAGEYYQVSCPFCGDTRKRLWVNHRWGFEDEVLGTKSLWLAICFNESCLVERSNLLSLYDRIYGFKNAKLRGQQPIVLPGKVEETVLREVELPGVTIRLDQLPKNHPACIYLRSRRLDPVELGKTFNVSLCVDASPKYPVAHGRLVLPVIMDKQVVGWQCRYPGELDWKTAKQPKYYNKPDMPGRLMLYNYDNAIQYPYVVITEGPFDAINVGPCAVATMGKHLPQQQMRLICEGWDEGVVMVMFDGDAWKETQAVAKRICEENYNGRVVPIQLSADRDPGSIDNAVMWEGINSILAKEGIDLSKLKRKEKDVQGKSKLLRLHRSPGTEYGVGWMGAQQPVSEHTADVQ
jgi:hypothetical protein